MFVCKTSHVWLKSGQSVKIDVETFFITVYYYIILLIALWCEVMSKLSNSTDDVFMKYHHYHTHCTMTYPQHCSSNAVIMQLDYVMWRKGCDQWSELRIKIKAVMRADPDQTQGCHQDNVHCFCHPIYSEHTLAPTRGIYNMDSSPASDSETSLLIL